ncbi:hypothetical protein KQI48_03615 [Cellulomonas hominis]|uniref:hypothetical protein n=1 Tax=Cellulomonas hominis TaxID=156981 RepID=UPI001C1259B7|nr:hypothetical protein [Cellulomonas hominis]MBU5421748.1 hypothetical protein [Cellulomonas hominis]
MEVSVADAADVLDVSPRRVRALIGSGRVHARLVAGVWLVDGATLPSGPRRSRSMSPANAWTLLTGSPAPASRTAAARIRDQLRRLGQDAEPERLLASWVGSRADRRWFQSRDVDAVAADARVVVSGLSDHRSAIAVGDLVEGYVLRDLLPELRRDLLLRPGRPGSGNVLLHVADRELPRPVPPLVLAADLAEHDRPRELARARELIREALA